MKYLGFEPSNEKPYYFVSYNSEDDYRIIPIVTALAELGISLWYDYGIQYDEKWEGIIAERVFNSESVLLFYTKGIIEKDHSYVLREYKIARLYRKKIYVVLLDPIDAAAAPFTKVSWLVELNEYQSISGSSQNKELICREIMRAIGFRANAGVSDPGPKLNVESSDPGPETNVSVNNPVLKTKKTIICNGNIVEEAIQRVSEKYADQPEFVQAVSEYLLSVKPAIVAKEYEYRKNAVLERMLEPDRQACFDVHWTDDRGQDQVNKGYCVLYNNALGTYRGSTRLYPYVNLSVMKFLSFELMFRNALSTLPLGSGMAGSDFESRFKSDSEIKRFCQSFARELYKYTGDDAELLRGNIGTGARELGYMRDAYRKERGGLEADQYAAGDSPFRKKAVGYGILYITKALWESRGMSLKGKTASVSGCGNVGIYAIEKAQQAGIRVITCSDSTGWIYDPAGIDVELLKEIKEIRRAKLSEYAAVRKSAEFHAGGYNRPGVWQYKVDIAIPCGTQNEIRLEDAKMLAANSVVSVTEGANNPLTPDAEEYLKEKGVMVLGSNAANIGGVIVSYLQDKNPLWTSEKFDEELENIMAKIYKNSSDAAEKYGMKTNGIPDYIVGADIAAFERVAEGIAVSCK